MTDVETPTLVELADGFVVRQEIDNMAWIDLGGEAAVIDALEHAEKERDVFAAIRKTLGDTPVRYVLNTHTHYDHVALNGAFVREWDAEVINQDTGPLPPEGRWFEGSGRRLLMRPMPDCHTSSDCIVWCPDDRVLFVGDIFGWGLIPLPGNVRDDNADHLVRTYRELVDYGAETVVPGHGPIGSTEQTLGRWLEYFAWLRREVSRRVSEGASDAEIVVALGPPEDMRDWWRFAQWKHEDSLQKVIKSIRRGWLSPE